VIRTVGVVPLAHLGTGGTEYTYRVPDGLETELKPGHLVQVPFVKTKVPGVVTRIGGDEKRRGLRPLLKLLALETVLLPHQLELSRWMSETYVAPLSDTLGAMLPPQAKKDRRSSRPDEDVLVVLTAAGREAVTQPDKLGRKRVKRQILERLTLSGGDAPQSDLLERPTWRTALNELEGVGMVQRVLLQNDNGTHPIADPSAAPILSQEQSNAVRTIVDSTGACLFLLHGVTGSGKTEVYMQVIAEMLHRGRSAVVMVPEISLTPQAVGRFSARFPGQVAVLHSGQLGSHRLREWKRVREGQARIVVGPRSAIFAPIPNLGVIVLDEEHDASYKQNESPRYHARDAAEHLGRLLGIPTVLGSATPDVGTYYRARKENIVLLELSRRPVWAANNVRSPTNGHEPVSRPMPSVEVVDLRRELKAGHREIFSRRLLTELEQTLDHGHQAILFLNRRGAAAAVICRSCGFVVQCSRCDTPMTYHSSREALICHRCNRRSRVPGRCPCCCGPNIRYLGAGTQRVVEEVERKFPRARVLRWDRDTAGKRDAHERLAMAFANHEADVLVGTQLVAKGLDFPLVTLVGAILADVGLHLPDFRAAERTFQLLTQVAGRAGRAELDSRVVVQTYAADHYAIQAAKLHDYWGFYKQEMTFRLASGYPPFARLIRFLLRSENAKWVERRAWALRELLQEEAERLGVADLEVIGPAPAFTARVNTVYQWHLLLRGSRPERLLGAVPDDVFVDVDPVDLL